MSPIQYPIQEELLLSLSGRTGKIVRWLLSERVQVIIGADQGWEITIHGKGENLSTAIKVHEKLK